MSISASGSVSETGYKRFFGLELAELLSEKIAAVEPGFSAQAFLDDVGASDLIERELLGRVELLATRVMPERRRLWFPSRLRQGSELPEAVPRHGASAVDGMDAKQDLAAGEGPNVVADR